MATLDWIKSQIGDYLNSDLDSLVISGQSAGAIGAQLWSHYNYIIENFKAKNKVVIIDSYLGVVLEQAVPIIDGFKICDKATKLFPSDVTICDNGQELKPDFLQTIVKSSMKAHPTVPFTFIQSKLDAFQIGFYELIIIDSWLLTNKLEDLVQKSPDPFPTLPCYLDLLKHRNNFEDKFEEFLVCVASKAKVSENFENLEKDILAAYGQVENFHAYLITGFTHTFTNKKYYYTTDPSGRSLSSLPSSCVKLDSWLNDKTPGLSMCVRDSNNDTNFCPYKIPSCMPINPTTAPTATSILAHEDLR